jgi:uncharacterized membrane protein
MLAVLGTTAASLVLGYLLKAQCTGPTYDAFGVSANFQPLKNRNLCYTDIQQLWLGRGIPEHVFPYVDGQLVDSGLPTAQLVGGALEYPVLTGLFMWFAGLFASTDGDYLRVTALMLAPFGLLTAALLARLAGWRALIWAAAPALVFYAFHNWDFLATAAVAAAVYAWHRGRPGTAAALLGLGAAAKIYPGFYVVPLLLERVYARDARGVARVVAGAGGAWLAVNLPIFVLNPSGWWATYEFQAGRPADITTNSIWFWGLPEHSPEALNRLSPTLIAIAWIAALAAGWLRAERTGSYPWLPVSAAMACAFLLFGKVYSPQYVLWLLPFFVLIRIRWGWWVAYLAADALLYVGLFRWYYDLTQGSDFGPAKQAAILGVWGHVILLALLYVVFLRSPLALLSPPAEPAGGARPRHAARIDSTAAETRSSSGAPSSTPPAGSSTPDDRTRSRSG